MKKTLLFSFVMSIMSFCVAQQTGISMQESIGTEPEEAGIIFNISSPEPRVGDWTTLTFCLMPFDSLIRSVIDTSAFKLESYSNSCLDLSFTPSDTGLKTIGPIKFNLNGTEYISDTLVIHVLPELKLEPGCYIRFLMMEDEYIVIVEEVRYEHVRYVTERDDFGRKQKAIRALNKGGLAELNIEAVGFCGTKQRFASRLMVQDEYPNNRKTKSWMLYSRSYIYDYSACEILEPVKKNFRNLPENTTITVTDYRTQSKTPGSN